MFGLTRAEEQILRRLRTPKKVQDFLEAIPINFEPEGDTCLSPRRVLRERRAHCIEGAMLAALALRLQGRKPLLVDLVAAPFDQDHVIAVFKDRGLWGAISKTNHAVLRFREPIFRTIRELALSYFHEYTDDRGKKTLRSFSAPVDLKRFDRLNWITAEDDVWCFPEHLTKIPHQPLLSRNQIQSLRRADALEIEAGRITAWQPPKN